MKKAASPAPPARPAVVRFCYRAANRRVTERRAEPYRVVLRDGRYYLVAYDLGRRDWRNFALDAIEGPIVAAGSFDRRPLPQRFLAESAIGWISGGAPREVIFRVSPLVAAAVTSKRWQDGQRVEHSADGGAQMTLVFREAAEAARWALRFAPEVVVLSPPDIAALLADTATKAATAQKRELRARTQGPAEERTAG